MRKKIVLPTFLFWCFISVTIGQQMAANIKYSDSSFYIVDSLDLKLMIEEERLFLDSSLTVFHESNIDTVKVKIVHNLVEGISNPKVWYRYNTWLGNFLAEKLELKIEDENLLKFYKSHLAKVLNNKGYYYRKKTPFLALKYYQESLAIMSAIEEEEGIALALNNMAGIYRDQGKILEALDYYSKTLELVQKLNYKEGIIVACNNIAGIYNSQGKIQLALTYYNQSLKLIEEFGDKTMIAFSYNNIAVMYQAQGKLELAAEYFNKSLELRKKLMIEKVSLFLMEIWE